MKVIILLLFAFMALVPVSLAESLLFSGTVITESDKVLSDGIFRFVYEESSNKVFAQTPTKNFIIENGQCKSNDVFKICIKSANFSDRNLTTYQTYYKLNLEIYKLTGSLTTSSKALSATLLEGESTDFTVTITNPTNFDITSINYDIDLSSFVVKEVKDCSLDNQHMTWKGSLKPNYEKKCAATLIAFKSGTYALAGTLNYFNGFETEKKTTDTVSIAVLPLQLKFNQTHDSKAEVQQPFYVNASIQNSHSAEPMWLTISIDLPWTIQVIKYSPELNKNKNTLARTFTLEPLAFYNYTLHLKPVAEADSKITQKFSYTLKSIPYSLEAAAPVKSVEPKPEIEFTSEYPILNPGQRFIIFVKLRNPSEIYDFKDVKVTLNVPYSEILQRSLPRLRHNESSVVVSNIFTMPQSIERDVNKINLSLGIKYTLNDEQKSASRVMEININQPAETSAVTANTTTRTNVQNTENKNTSEEQPKAANENKNEQPIIKDSINSGPKFDFFDKRILIFVGSVFLLLIIVPVIFHLVRKKGKKMPSQERLSPSDTQPPDKPKDF